MSSQDSKPSKPAPKNARPLAQQRRKARHYGMQALYRWHMNGGTPADIEAEFRTDYDFTHADIEYFRAILEGVIYHQPEIDAAFAAHLDRDIKQLTPVELSLLRQAVFELKDRQGCAVQGGDQRSSGPGQEIWRHRWSQIH